MGTLNRGSSVSWPGYFNRCAKTIEIPKDFYLISKRLKTGQHS
jgi:hypothetical protein